VVLALVVLAVGTTTATAAPAGPRLTLVAVRKSAQTQLLTMGPAGGERSTVFSHSEVRFPLVYPSTAPAWSSDGSRLAFTAVTGKRRKRLSLYPRTAIGLVGADGGEVRLLPGTAAGAAPVFAPDGTRLAYAKVRRRYEFDRHGGGRQLYSSASLWLLDLSSGENRRLTPWRNGLLQVPSSFSPDGTRVAFSRLVDGRPPEALAMAFDGSATTVLVRNGVDPVYSPDGTQIAFLRGPVKTRRSHGWTTTARLTDLYTVSAAGGDLRRLTRTRATAEVAPSWDPSGQRLSYTAMRPFGSEDALFGFGNQIREINADGTCSTRILSSRRVAFYGAAWQPGPGREAGPISC
jgi:Tol biopolymer transport system component